MRINSKGFRGREYEQDKKKHFRIIARGDSITFAWKINDEDTYVGKFEDFLRKIDPKFEFLNFGVNGYDTYQEILFLEKNGSKFLIES